MVCSTAWAYGAARSGLGLGWPWAAYDWATAGVGGVAHNIPLPQNKKRKGRRFTIAVSSDKVLMMENKKPRWSSDYLPDETLRARAQHFPRNSGVEERALAISRRLPTRPAVFAEIGVYAGDVSEMVLRWRPDVDAVLVDSWTAAPLGSDWEKTRDGHAAMCQTEHELVYQFCRERMAFAGSAVRIMPLDSLTAAALVDNATLDLVFLDADHSLEAVRSDIEAWLPKVKPGGWIGGHDYANEMFPLFGVKQAVDERFGSQVELDANYTWFVRV